MSDRSTTKSWTLAVVVDASALVELLLATSRGRAVADAVVGSDMLAPDLINAESRGPDFGVAAVTV